MELIERNELYKRIAEQETWNVPDFVYDEIRNAPTVKAIPIEFIFKWSKSFWKEINGRKYYTGDGYDTVWDMIEAWEKRNE